MPPAPTLLVPEDDPALLAELRAARPGWTLLSLADPAAMTSGAAHVWAFVDWLGADMSGAERCRRLRAAHGRAVHVTMVLDGRDPDDRRHALLAGADDYLIGPLDVARIVARIEPPARVAAKPRPQLGFDDVVIDVAAHRVQHGGAMIPLRPNEFRLLVHFAEHPDRVLSRAALIEGLGKLGTGVDERTVDVWVGRLRRTLVAHGVRDPLRTVRSFGYVFDTIAEAPPAQRSAAG